MITRASISALYTPIYDEFMLATYDEPSQVGTKIFKDVDDSTYQYIVDDLSGLGRWVSADEGASGGYEDPTLGYSKTYTQAKFWKKFQVSFEAVDWDEYALLKKEGDMREMGRGARDLVEYSKATILNDGFSTACPDAAYLFDTDHPANRDATTTYRDNLLTGALSHDNLETAEAQIADNLITLAGIPIAITQKPILLVPPALKGLALRLVSDRADERPGTTNRDINVHAGKYTPVDWIYLSANNGGSDTAWFIIFPWLEHLKAVWTARPHTTSWVDEDSEFYKFKGRMLAAFGNDNWRCGFGSTGL